MASRALIYQVMSVTPSRLSRYTQLFVGLIAYGIALGLMLAAELGTPAWTVLHEGIAVYLGYSVGRVSIAVSVLVLLLWVPLQQRPGIGTVLNAVVVGLVMDAVLILTGPMDGIALRASVFAGSLFLYAFAVVVYIGARLGPGPRDGLMTGIASRGYSLGAARTVVESVALLAGWILGGTVGIGTALFVVSIGWLIQIMNKFVGRLSWMSGIEESRRSRKSGN